MKVVDIVSLSALLMALASCSVTDQVVPDAFDGRQVTLSLASDTKLLLDSRTIKWDAVEEVAVYSLDGEETSPASGSIFTKKGDKVIAKADFSGTIKKNTVSAYAVYPCFTSGTEKQTAFTFDPDSKRMSITLPGAQELIPGSFAPSSNVMACVLSVDNSSSLSGMMKNACAYIRFRIDNSATVPVRQVLVEAKNGTPLTGAAVLRFNDKGIPMAEPSGEPYVCGYSPDGGALRNGTYWLCVYPADVYKGASTGLRITLSGVGGSIYEVDTEGFVMERNNIYDIGTVDEDILPNRTLSSATVDGSVIPDAPDKVLKRLNVFFRGDALKNGANVTVGGMQFTGVFPDACGKPWYFHSFDFSGDDSVKPNSVTVSGGSCDIAGMEMIYDYNPETAIPANIDAMALTVVSPGETKAVIPVSLSGCEGLTATVLPGSTLENVSVTRATNTELALAFKANDDDLTVEKSATIRLTASASPGFSDTDPLDVTITQRGTLKLVFDAAATWSEGHAGWTDSNLIASASIVGTASSVYKTAGGSAYTVKAPFFYIKTGQAYLTVKHANSKDPSSLGFVEFPAIQGMTLKKIIISFKGHSVNCSCSLQVTDAEENAYSGMLVRNDLKSGTVSSTIVLGADGSLAPQPGTAYRLSAMGDASELTSVNCLVNSIELAYE